MSLLLPISATKTATATVAGIWPWLSLHGEVCAALLAWLGIWVPKYLPQGQPSGYRGWYLLQADKVSLEGGHEWNLCGRSVQQLLWLLEALRRMMSAGRSSDDRLLELELELVWSSSWKLTITSSNITQHTPAHITGCPLLLISEVDTSHHTTILIRWDTTVFD